jgi:transcriptional regulator with XRE-family HTH domain
MNAREQIGLQLMEARKKKQMTQQEVADQAGITRPNLSRIESGKYNASIDIISKVCDAIGVKITIQEEAAR